MMNYLAVDTPTHTPYLATQVASSESSATLILGIVGVVGTLLAALIGVLAAPLLEKHKWLRQERQSIYATYLSQHMGLFAVLVGTQEHAKSLTQTLFNASEVDEVMVSARELSSGIAQLESAHEELVKSDVLVRLLAEESMFKPLDRTLSTITKSITTLKNLVTSLPEAIANPDTKDTYGQAEFEKMDEYLVEFGRVYGATSLAMRRSLGVNSSRAAK